MRTGKKLLLGTLAFGASVGVIGATVYATKTGDCPSIKEYGPYNQKYDVAIIYEGGPNNSPIRMREAGNLHNEGLFEEAILTGYPEMREMLIKLSDEYGIRYRTPQIYSTNTTEDIRQASKLKKVNEKVAHITGKNQLPRVKFVVNREDFDPENNDGYFPVDDEYRGNLFGVPHLREQVACAATRFGLERYKKWFPFLRY